MIDDGKRIKVNDVMVFRKMIYFEDIKPPREEKSEDPNTYD